MACSSTPTWNKRKRRNKPSDQNPRRRRLRLRLRRWKPNHPSSLPPPIASRISPRVVKYWHQRYSLFSLYDRGVAMDEEGWFSVTPESIAAQQAHHVGAPTLVVDCFAGVGGNAIQFAKAGCRVLAIEIDQRRVELARNNAEVYGVEDRIEFVVGDFFKLAPSLKADVLFLSPPWGGPVYSAIETFTLDLLKPMDGYKIFQLAQKVTPNIIMFLPRNVDVNQVEELSWLSSPPLDFELWTFILSSNQQDVLMKYVSDIQLQENYIRNTMKGITAYFGDLASR